MVFMQLSLIITLPCDYLFEVLPIAIFYCHICIIDEVEVVAEWLIILVAYHTHEHLICIGSLSQTYGSDRTGTHCMWPEEGCDVKVDMHCICTFKVHSYWSFMLAWSEDDECCFFITRGIILFICGGVLFIVYHGLYFFMGILLAMLHNVVHFFMQILLYILHNVVYFFMGILLDILHNVVHFFM